MPSLTPREKRVYEMRHSTDPPMTYRAIGRQIGVAEQTARNIYRRASDKKANEGVYLAPAPRESTRTEYTDPEKAAAMIDVVTNPMMRSVQAACDEAGLPAETTRALLARMEREYQPALREIRKVKTEGLVRKLETLADDALDSITQEKLDEASAYQLTVISAIALDKRELLDGRPTERLSVEDRRKLPEILSALMVEAERRGLMREVNPETGRVYLSDREDAPPDVRTGRARMPEIGAGS